MKKFSATWASSRNPGKQRKYFFNAPLHIRNRFMTAKLAKELAKKHGIKRLAVRKGDKVRIARGQFRGRTGKVNRADPSRVRIYIDGIDRTKTEGSKAFYPVHPSNVIIIELSLEDRRRIKKPGKKDEKQA